MSVLSFEQKIVELESKVAELRYLAASDGIDLAQQIVSLEAAIATELKKTYGRLTAWQRVLVSRHPGRPSFQDYAAQLLSQRVPLAGDRLFAEDQAINVDIGRFRGTTTLWAGHEKGGAMLSERVTHNFGMARPEGYRKFVRALALAERFSLPVVTLVNTPGAFPGVDAEARGQAEAIAQSINACLAVQTPFVSVIVGEGGSGGAVALASSDVVLMLEHATYAVISPEGCSAILWRDTPSPERAAESLKLTAQDLLDLGVIDGIIPEPLGGAHRNVSEVIKTVGDAVHEALAGLLALDAPQLQERRRQRFLSIGETFLQS